MANIFDVINKQGYYIIAEIGVNHFDIASKMNISVLDAAKMMCKSAKISGADAVKFQSYKAENIASKNSPAYWDTTQEPTRSQYELFKKFDAFGEKEFNEIKKFCDEIDVEFMSTPFDFHAVEYLDKIMNVFKISSSDITNIPFIEYICKKKKPIILSVGAANEKEIDCAVNLIKKYGNPLIILHCVLEYPTPYSHANLKRIKFIKEKYKECIIGYSDHTKPEHDYDVLKTAYLYGAQVIEKHFTLDKTIVGNDHYHAMDDNDLKIIKENFEYINSIAGDGGIDCNSTEESARINARRSIVATRNIEEGEVIREEAITFKRPGIGIEPGELKNVIGKTARKKIFEDSVLMWEDICR